MINQEELSIQLEIELAALGNPERRDRSRDEDGYYTLPYIRFNQLLKPGEQPEIQRDGQPNPYASVAAAYPSDQRHTLIYEFDLVQMARVRLNEKGAHWAIGHLMNGMTLEAVGRLSSAIMAPSHALSRWRQLGTCSNRKEEGSRFGAGKQAALNLKAGVKMPQATEKQRARAVGRNYWAIEQERKKGKKLEDIVFQATGIQVNLGRTPSGLVIPAQSHNSSRRQRAR